MQRAVSVPSTTDDTAPLTAFADPEALPARIALAPIGAADLPGGSAELTRDHVVVRREGGDPEQPTVVAPLGLYRGVAVSVRPPAESGELVFDLCLHHGDPALVVPLATGTSLEAIAELWRGFARVFGLPMLAIDQSGCVHGGLHQIGGFFAAPPAARRRGSALVGRRSRAARRRTAPAEAPTAVIRGEREIIARN